MARQGGILQIRVFNVFLALILALIAQRLLGADVPVSTGLHFHQVVEDPISYNQNPGKFEVLKGKTVNSVYEVYIELVPSFSIPINAIATVTLEKETYDDRSIKRDMAKDDHGHGSGNAKVTNKSASMYVYKATFSLNQNAGKAFSGFATTRDGQEFDLRLGRNSLGLVRLVGPFGASDKDTQLFATFLESKDPRRIDEIFEPLKNKLTWR